MLFKKCILFVLLFLLGLLILLVGLSVNQAKSIHRDTKTLMYKYHTLKETTPLDARQFLLVILAQDPNNIESLRELSQSYLADGDTTDAAPLLERLKNLNQSNHVGNGSMVQLVMRGVNYLTSFARGQAIATPINQRPTGRPRDPAILLNTKAHSTALYRSGSRRRTAGQEDLRSRAYAAREKNLSYAIQLLSRAYADHPDQKSAMQLGYWYSSINNQNRACYYFKKATKGLDKKIALDADQALTRLAGMQTKWLKSPYFSELFLTPFIQSRFSLDVLQLNARLGIEQQNMFNTREYIFYRQTQDNRSKNLGQLTQLYEDNVEISGVGGQMTPFRKLPLVAFLETGAAYDLVYQNRNRWRTDVRGGVMYYQDVGAQPEYVDEMTIGHRYFGSWYGDVTYFSRYSNTIGGIRTNQGIRLIQYHASMVNLYMTGRVIGDSRRLFFNNYAEMGPGISLVPSNRYNIQIRMEHVRGTYLPAGGSPNPYSTHYTNNLIQLLFYMKL